MLGMHTFSAYDETIRAIRAERRRIASHLDAVEAKFSTLRWSGTLADDFRADLDRQRALLQG